MMFAASGSARLAYDVAGVPGSGSGVLLIHAGVTDRRSWAPLVAALEDQHYSVAYDARGFGETTYQPEAFSPVDDAVAVMDASGLRRPVLVAASMGGRTAIDLALAHPERVSGLVLIGPAVSGAPEVDDPPEAQAISDALDAADEAGDLDEVNRLEARLWLDGLPAPEGRVGGDTRALFLDMNCRALAAEDPGEGTGSDPAWSRLEQLAAPTLVIVGDLDLAECHERARELAKRVPGAEVLALADVAHLPHLEADRDCLVAIGSFLERHGVH